MYDFQRDDLEPHPRARSGGGTFYQQIPTPTTHPYRHARVHYSPYGTVQPVRLPV